MALFQAMNSFFGSDNSTGGAIMCAKPENEMQICDTNENSLSQLCIGSEQNNNNKAAINFSQYELTNKLQVDYGSRFAFYATVLSLSGC